MTINDQPSSTLKLNLNFPVQFAVLDFGLAVRSGGWKHEWKAGKGVWVWLEWGG